MMENKLVQRLLKEVNEVITSEREKDALFEALKRYQESSDIGNLIGDLHQVLNEPARLEIYEFVRPLVRPQHQQQYDKLAPSAPGQKLRVIRLRRRQNESLGFAVRGGFEHNIGVFVSEVIPGSQAEQHGLRVGDEIVRVNGFTIVEAIHEEVLNLIKGKDEIELKVTNIGMIPVKQNPKDPVTWKYVNKAGNIKQQIQATGSENNTPAEEVKIFINTRGATGLGCSIRNGGKTFPGVFIETVKPGGLAEAYCLDVGDQIVEVNGKSFLDIKHEEAIVELRGSKELNMVIRKKVALPLFNALRQQQQKSPRDNPQPQRTNPPRNEPQPGPSYYEPKRSPEILEDIEAEERRLWEEEQERLKKQREEERVKAQFRQREMERQAELERKKQEEERRRNDEERQRRLLEEKKKQEEKEREEQRRRAEELERKREEMEKRVEEEKQKMKAEEKKKKAQAEDITQQKRESAVLAGRAGPVNAMKPALLGAADTTQKAPTSNTDYRNIKEVVIRKEEDIPLDIEVQGGTDSPLGGKIVVAEVYHEGLAHKNGGITKGDQIVKVNGKSLEDKTLSEAQEILWNAEQDPGDTIKLLVIESDFKEDEIIHDVMKTVDRAKILHETLCAPLNFSSANHPTRNSMLKNES